MKTFLATQSPSSVAARHSCLAPPAAGRWCKAPASGSTLRVTVLDQTDAALVIAQVTIVDARGVEQTAAVDDRGVATFENLTPGTYQVKAHGGELPPAHHAVQRAAR